MNSSCCWWIRVSSTSPHHAEMVALTFELTLEVDKIGGGGVEALGEQPAEKGRDLRVRLEEAFSVFEHEGTDRRARTFNRISSLPRE